MKNKIRAACFFLAACVYISCSAPGKNFFGKRTPHEIYSDGLKGAGLNTTALGMLWFEEAQKALQQPVLIQIPYKETGYFAAEKPAAAGYKFIAGKGQKISISINTGTSNNFKMFADLWTTDTTGEQFLKAADTLNLNIEHEVNESRDYVLRIQPELLKSGFYTVSVIATGSLAFPVPSEINTTIGSFWGDDRDKGIRKHEGVDIFGKFRTPVIAAADGNVSVQENRLGGKVIFLRPNGKDYTLYYAHLDSQIATQGQSVKTGDIIGLIGNTGNAKYTPPHLHFGIYTFGGAVDPLPFITSTQNKPKEITASIKLPGGYARATKTTTVLTTTESKAAVIEKIDANTALHILAATANWYKVELPSGLQGFINSTVITTQQTAFRNYKTDTALVLLDNAYANSAPKKLVAKDVLLPVYGLYKDFYLVEYEGIKGWIQQ